MGRIVFSGQGLLVAGALTALALAIGIGFAPVEACEAQIAAAQDARPGFTILAGEPSDPACAGRKR